MQFLASRQITFSKLCKLVGAQEPIAFNGPPKIWLKVIKTSIKRSDQKKIWIQRSNWVAKLKRMQLIKRNSKIIIMWLWRSCGEEAGDCSFECCMMVRHFIEKKVFRSNFFLAWLLAFNCITRRKRKIRPAIYGTETLRRRDKKPTGSLSRDKRLLIAHQTNFSGELIRWTRITWSIRTKDNRISQRG